MRILGDCIGVRAEERGKGDRHAVISVMVEDDDNWHDAMSVSSYWLDEFIDVLQQMRRKLKAKCVKSKWGYEFKK